MVNTIQTIRNLKEKFPRFQLDTILQIIECIDESETTENGMLIQPKGHGGDKTGSNVVVTEPNHS